MHTFLRRDALSVSATVLANEGKLGENTYKYPGHTAKVENRSGEKEIEEEEEEEKDISQWKVPCRR
jgi:hypothetical protein